MSASMVVPFNMHGMKMILLLLSVFPLVTSMAQDRTVDSLVSLAGKAPQDTAKARLLVRAAQAARRVDARQSISLAKEALDISKKADFQWGIAWAHRVEAIAYYDLSEYPDAMSQFDKALKGFEKLGDQAGVAGILNGIGAIYFDKGDDTNAIRHYLRGLKIAESINDGNRIHTFESNLGAVYQRKEKTRDQALLYYERALNGFKAIGKLDEYSTTAGNIGEIHLERGDLDNAERYFSMAIDASGETINACFPLTKLGEVYALENDLGKAKEIHQRSIRIARQFDAPKELSEALIGLARVQEAEKDHKGAIATYEQSLDISRSLELDYHRRDAYQELARIHSTMGDYRKAFDYQVKLDAIKDTLFNSDEQNKMQQMQFNFDLNQKQTQLDLKDLRIRQQEYIGYGAAIFLVLVLTIAIVIYQRYAFARKTNAIIQAERDRSKELLLNILPEETARELETHGFAKTRYHEDVTVLFTDFKGFSTIAGKLTPQALVAELNNYFVAFDEIIEKYNLEKIKTIGDAYMCAGGIPTADPENALNAVKAAMEMQRFMQKEIRQKNEEGLQPWELRVGVHTGPVVAGVVGKKKYAYDIWGDTVNIASRMESTGEPGKVNISASTHEKVKDHFRCTYRGKLAAKNIGEIDMYFVEADTVAGS